jgi:hypothetical protein
MLERIRAGARAEFRNGQGDKDGRLVDGVETADRRAGTIVGASAIAR